jgi:hypothetical protein
MADRLFRQPERARRAISDLDEDELGWRTRVDGEKVDLGPADADVTAEDRPARSLEARRDVSLGDGSAPLGEGPAGAFGHDGEATPGRSPRAHRDRG